MVRVCFYLLLMDRLCEGHMAGEAAHSRDEAA